MGNTDKILSLKDFDPNSTQLVNKARRRQHIMEKNMKASQIIIAAKKLKVERLSGDLTPAMQELKKMKTSDTLPLEAYTKTFDKRLGVLGKKVKNLTELKEAQDGFLKEGQEAALKDYSLEISRLEIEREQFVIKYEAKLKREAEAEKETEKLIKAQTKEDAKDNKTMEGKDIVMPDKKELLIAKAKELGIKATKAWGIPKLEKAIKEAE